MMKKHQANIKQSFIKIKVLGVGGSGCNSISRLSALKFPAVECIAVNTDFHSLSTCSADRIIKIGADSTKGLGTGGDPLLGKAAAEESFRELIRAIQSADLLFLTAGLGGGTGSGAIEIIARIASSLDIPTISIVTLPFSYESSKRKNIAYETTIKLQPFTNTIITIPNDRITNICDPETPLISALGMADDILINAIMGISEMMKQDGLLNVDFSHIKKLLGKSGGAYISIGYGKGNKRALSAINDALSHPLLEPVPVRQAKGIIIKLIGDLEMHEIDGALEYLHKKVTDEAEIIPVVDYKEFNDGQIKAAIMLTGMGATPLPKADELVKEKVNKAVDTEIPETIEDNFTYSKAVEDFQDDLEIPAFIRKGY
ncbi:MAG: cell division FtsZ family protein, partial [Anaerolineaceae bacterium]|nr:cell division FtsZ family protein [Anaerolineaceae bacterium]